MKPLTHRLLPALLLLFLTLGTLTTAFAQITPSQDSYTNTATPATNFGTAATLGVISSNKSIQNTYIQFDLSSIPAGYTSANVAKATLKLYVNSVPTAGSFNVDYINGSWTEKTITANLAPALGTPIASSVPLTTANVNNYLEIDVTAAVGEWLNGSQANDGVALVANSGLSATFDSKESGTQSHPAELDVVFTSGGTISGVNTGSGSGLTGGGTNGTLNLALTNSCSSKQVLQWNGSAWACAAVGTGTISGVTAGAGLTGGGTSGNVTLNLDTTQVPLKSAPNGFTGQNSFDNTQAFMGNNFFMYTGDPGCGAGYAGIGFGQLSGCTNYALAGSITDTFLNRPTGGTLHFRENNADEVVIYPGGTMAIAPSPFAGNYALTSTTGATFGVGVFGGTSGDSSYGVYGFTTGTNSVGVFGSNGNGIAGQFFGQTDVEGDLTVSGAIFAGIKDFKIDHPMDPANKYLYHASVESSEMMNIYTGNVTTDAQGQATVTLPEWFEALNTDFRYQLTVVGQFAQAIVGQKIANHQFQIKTNAPNVEVSWQVTGVRQDAYAKAHPFVVEEEKDAQVRGFYIHPELYGAPEEKQIEWARHPATMKRIKEQRSKAAIATKP